jgi:hypothetical protein
MKNKFAIIALSMSLFASSAAFAVEEKAENKGENFAKHKAEIVADLNKEKGILDQTISCVSATAGKEGVEKCREQKHAAMEKLRQEKINQQKARLQDKIKKLDEKSKNPPHKGGMKGGDSTTNAE